MTGLEVALRLIVSPLAIALAAVTTIATITLARPLARRFGGSIPLAASAIVSVGLIAAATAPVTQLGALARVGEVWDATRALTWLGSGWTDVLLVPRGIEGWANVLLFVPAGYAWTRLTGRPKAIVLVLVLVSLLAESLQAAVGIRVAEPRDLLANSVGAAMGIVVGMTVNIQRRLGTRQFLLQARRPRVVAAAVTGLVIAGIGVRVAATYLDQLVVNEQMALLDDVEDSYAGTRASDVAALDSPQAYAAYATRPGLPADYLGEVSEGVFEARFKVADTARARCVLVRWTQEGTTVTPASGSTCTSFNDVGVRIDDDQ